MSKYIIQDIQLAHLEASGSRKLLEMPELIRCRDCIYWRDEDFCANPQWQTGGPSNGLIAFPCTFPENFCSYAEKREGDE